MSLREANRSRADGAVESASCGDAPVPAKPRGSRPRTHEGDTTIGIVAIGQSPRPDLAAAFAPDERRTRALVVGSLDRVSEHEIRAMMTTHSKWPLETVLRGGRAVTVPKEEIEPRLSACAGHLVDQGATVVVLACTAEFHHLRCAVPVIYPSQVVAGVVEALAVTRRLGVVSPSPQQQHVLRERWRERGFDVSIVSAAPCRTNELEQAAAELRTQEVEAVVLDCMGYDATWHRRFALQVGLPVVNPRTIVAAVVSAVVAGFPLSRVLGGAVRG